MLDLLKKGLFAGIGAVVLTTDKVREMTGRLVEEGRLTSDEAEKLTDDLIKSGERQWDEFSQKSQDVFRRMVDSMDMVKRREFMDLKARIELLEQRVVVLESAVRKEQGESSEY